MKFLVFSDTHGKIKRAIDVCHMHETEKIDGIIHLGDYIQDAETIEEEINLPMYCVKGNCDGDYGEGDYKIIEAECGDILLTHGHGQKVKSTLMNLIYRAQELNCVAALFGHTHVPLSEETEGILLVNPGSLTQPGIIGKGSYAILTTSEDGVEATICYYDSDSRKFAEESSSNAGPTKPKKVTGGHLRNILNNCDRL